MRKIPGLMKCKVAFGVVLASLIVCGSYWIKSVLGLDVSEDYSVGKYPPFCYLRGNDTIEAVEGTVLFEDSFEWLKVKNNWLRLWTQAKGKVAKGYASDGIEGSRCLLVRSGTREEWSLSHNKFVKVNKGDRFSYSAFVLARGYEARASVSVDSFDKDKKAIKWKYISLDVSSNREWKKHEKTFVIGEGVKYIRFRLSGIGVGEFRFDNVSFRKE